MPPRLPCSRHLYASCFLAAESLSRSIYSIAELEADSITIPSRFRHANDGDALDGTTTIVIEKESCTLVSIVD
ncbi:hypothetical protein Q3G72_001496 [Acer saccharum]|nr:hypothetical protein Q3G72_001496 [Acer saccharum]